MKITTLILLALVCCSCSKHATLQDLPKEPISITEARFYEDGGSIGILGTDGNGRKFDLFLYNGLEKSPNVRPYFILGTTEPEKKKGMVVGIDSAEEKALILAFRNFLNSTTVKSDERNAAETILELLK